MENNIDRIERKLDDILTVLTGDDLHGAGLVKRVTNVEDTVEKHKSYFRTMNIIWGIIVVVLSILSGCKKLF